MEKCDTKRDENGRTNNELKSKNSGWREGHMYNDTDGQMDEHIQTERKKKRRKTT